MDVAAKQKKGKYEETHGNCILQRKKRKHEAKQMYQKFILNRRQRGINISAWVDMDRCRQGYRA